MASRLGSYKSPKIIGSGMIRFGSCLILMPGMGGKERGDMSAEVETMMFTGRERPWYGLGTMVEEAPDSREALVAAGLDWDVVQRPIFTQDGVRVKGYFANVRYQDDKILGVVTNRYKVVQNREAFAFTDELLGEGVRYETAGSLMEGKKVWILAKLPSRYIMQGEQIMPYLVFSNTHDGSGAIKIAMTPIRVVCNNTLNLALDTARRCWSVNHTGDIALKMEEAKETLFMAEDYMSQLGKEFDSLMKKRLSDAAVEEYISLLLPIGGDASQTTEKNVLRLREDIRNRYYYAPDLKNMGKNAYRFINAVSDFATHAKPLRQAKNYQETLFNKTMEGNPVTDKAHRLLMAG